MFAGMVYVGGANPQQLAMLARVLDEFCREHQIETIAARENAAALIMCLFRRGYQKPGDLKALLDGIGTGTIH